MCNCEEGVRGECWDGGGRMDRKMRRRKDGRVDGKRNEGGRKKN